MEKRGLGNRARQTKRGWSKTGSTSLQSGSQRSKHVAIAYSHASWHPYYLYHAPRALIADCCVPWEVHPKVGIYVTDYFGQILFLQWRLDTIHPLHLPTMAPKRAASSSKAAPKSTPKVAAKEKPSALETASAVAGSVLKKAKRKVSEVVENAGEMLIDDVAEVQAPKEVKKTQAKKGKVAKEVEPVVEKATAALKKAGKKVAKVVDNVGDMIIDDVSPEAETAARGTKRKTAEDFMPEKEEKKVKAVKAAVKEKAKPAAKAAKGKASKKEPTPEAESEAEASEASFIGAFDSDDDMNGADSSDDESDMEDEAIRQAGKSVQVSTLPAPKDDKSVAQRLKKASKKKVSYILEARLMTERRARNNLPRPYPTRILRGRNQRVLWPVRRRDPLPPCTQPQIRSIKALRLRRVFFRPRRRDRRRDNAQLPPHGTFAAVRRDPAGRGAPRALGWSEQKVQEGA